MPTVDCLKYEKKIFIQNRIKMLFILRSKYKRYFKLKIWKFAITICI